MRTGIDSMGQKTSFHAVIKMGMGKQCSFLCMTELGTVEWREKEGIAHETMSKEKQCQ